MKHELDVILSFLLDPFHLKVTYKPLIITWKGKNTRIIVYCKKNKGEVVCLYKDLKSIQVAKDVFLRFGLAI